jgi:hypothetical protein
MDDLGKIAVIAGIMGALLLFGLLANRPETVQPEVAEVVEESSRVTLPVRKSLELLDPVYSEKAIFHDSTIRVAFQPTFIDEWQVGSRLGFWLHNVSGDVINVLWDRCSLQLPSGNTVAVLSENTITFGSPLGQILSVAPGGDLFDAFLPVTEFEFGEEAPNYSVDVLDDGAFTLVLAIERTARVECLPEGAPMIAPAGGPCGPGSSAGGLMLCPQGQREVVHYTFRFVIR